MTLYQIVSVLKQIALTQPNVKSATDGSVYDVMNTNPSVKYDVVHLTQTKHISYEETDIYGFNIFYISRLEDSLEDNRLQIQSIGKEILDNILRTFCENWSIDYPEIMFYPFTQKFTDLCAGVYCKVEIEVPKEIICADDFIGEVIPSDKNIRLQDVSVTITENGTRIITPSAGFDGIGQITIETDVPSAGRLEYKEVEYTHNGEHTITPSAGYDGLAEVAVSVDVPGYDEGYSDGEEAQKAKLVATSFTQNDTYYRVNGWSAVTVNVPATEDRYDEGFTDGYNSGYTDGEEAQKAKLTALTVTENGEYTRTDGWSSVTVNVPATTAYTDQDLIANLQGNYYVIPDGTTHLRPYAFYGTCFSSITIPTSVSAIGYSAFEKNTCLREITIPDSVLSIGFGAFQECSNLTSVTLSNSLTKLDNGLFAKCTSLPSITIPANISSVGGRVFENCRSLTAMTFLGLNPPSLYDIGTGYNPSLGSTAYTFPIYVPCESLEAYKTAFGQYYAPRIQCIPVQATAITLNVDSAITDSATATTTVSPSGATTDITYSSSDPTIATIDSGTGVITVITDGTVTICATDSISNLQDCKTVNVSLSPGPSLNEPLTMYIIQDGDIVWKTTDASFATTIQYKKNDGNWTIITSTTGGTVIPVVSGDTVWFRGNNAQYSQGGPAYSGYIIPAPYNTFSGTTAGFELGNNIMSLISSTNFANLTTFQSAYTFCGLFEHCSGLTKAENLLMPATALTNYCYCGMFNVCTGLTSAPELPATTLATACYEGMFYLCTHLTAGPSILPATTLQPYCYSFMFNNCSNLTTAPELPASQLVNYCYLHMFAVCAKLNTVKCLATNISAENCTLRWMGAVASTGTFTKAANMSSWTTGDDGIPSGWTVQNAS